MNKDDLPNSVLEALYSMKPLEVKCETFEVGYKKKNIYFIIANDYELLHYLQEYNISDNLFMGIEFRKVDYNDHNSDGELVMTYDLIIKINLWGKIRNFRYQVCVPHHMKREQLDIAEVLLNDDFNNFFLVVSDRNNCVLTTVPVHYKVGPIVRRTLFKIIERE